MMERKDFFEFDGYRVESESFLDKDSYCVVSDAKKDDEGVPYHLEVAFDIAHAKFHFSKCYAHQVVMCQELSSGGKLQVMVYIIKKVGEAYLQEQGKQKKLTLAKVKVMYRDSDVVMGEMLSSTSADGLSVEEAFYLYVAAQNWASGDAFSQVLGDNDECEVDLVKEALRLNQ